MAMRPAVGCSRQASLEQCQSPVLVEVRRILNRQVSLFSGAEFNVDDIAGLNTVTINLLDYPLPPVEQILGVLVWMVQEG